VAAEATSRAPLDDDTRDCALGTAHEFGSPRMRPIRARPDRLVIALFFTTATLTAGWIWIVGACF
jgi:hypothetical protein